MIKEVMDLIPTPIIIIDKDYNVVWMNKRAKQLYSNGYEKCYQLTHNLPQPCDTYENHPCPLKEIKEKGVSKYSVVHRHKVNNKESLVFLIAEYNPEHNLYIEFQLPLEELYAALDVQRLRPEILINSGPLTFFVWENREGWPVKEVSQSVYELTEYTQEDFLKGLIDYAKLIHPDDMQRVSEEVEFNTKNKSDYWTHQPYRIITKSGKVKWVLDHTVSIKNNKGEILGYYGYVMDISEFYEKDILFRIIAENNPNGVLLYDFMEDKIVFTNKALLKMLKYDEKELVGGSALRLIHKEDLHKAVQAIQRRKCGYNGIIENSYRLITSSGRTKWVKIISNVITFKGRELSLITVIDLTKEKVWEKQLFRLATTDRLTKLFNRYAGNKFFENLIHQAERYSTVFSVLLLDVDNFKEINDRLGHLAGDHVLSSVAKIIKKSLRKSDISIRWGGEEFLILLPNTRNPLPVAEKIRRQVGSLVYNNYGHITVSIGCTIYTNGDTMDSMIQRADKALYMAKSLGKNRVEIA